MSLPPDSSPGSLAYNSSGTLAVDLTTYPGIYHNDVFIVSSSGPGTEMAAPSDSLVSEADTFYFGTPADGQIGMLNGSSVANATKQSFLGLPTAGPTAPVDGGVLTASGTYVAYSIVSGIGVVGSSGAVTNFTLQNGACGPDAPSLIQQSGTLPPVSAATSCPTQAVALAADGTGDIWYVVAGAGSIGDITPSQYDQS